MSKYSPFYCLSQMLAHESTKWLHYQQRRLRGICISGKLLMFTGLIGKNTKFRFMKLLSKEIMNFKTKVLFIMILKGFFLMFKG